MFGVLAAAAGVAFANGKVTHLSGTLSAQKPDGSVKILAQKSDVLPGDLLSTEKDSFAQINFTDGSQMTMRPNTKMKVELFRFNKEAPQSDVANFRLLKGGLRTVTGLIGKRGDQEAYKISTATATIGIRGSSGDTLDCSVDCAGVTSTSDKVEKGLYHTTYTGSYILTNDAGSQIIGEGQFGFVRDARTAPVLLPADPGLNLKELPFVLSIFEGAGIRQGQPAECVVR
ncbi:MAG: FecR domain-containing protein [Betaproteobacteria bacterium]|nr:FecR domain-containing protein [Betaproteobacteria bacterium]